MAYLSTLAGPPSCLPHTNSLGANGRPVKYNMRLPELHHNSDHAHRWAWKPQQRLSLTQVRSSLLETSLSSLLRIVHASGITYDVIEAAFVGYVYGASTCGQSALYQLGLTGIPITNVNNNCATGSVALFHAATLVRAGEARCALALGFERMAPGALGDPWLDRPSPIRPLLDAAARAAPDVDLGAPPMPRVFGAAAAEYFRLHGGGVECLAKIGEFFWNLSVVLCVDRGVVGLAR
jgi:acetyl-CoA acetyltransferase